MKNDVFGKDEVKGLPNLSKIQEVEMVKKRCLKVFK